MDGLLASGQLFISRFNPDGTPQDWGDVGNTKSFSLHEQADAKVRLSNNPDTFATPLNSVPIPKPLELAIKTDELNPATLAIIFRGETAPLSEGAGTATVETFAATPGKYRKLGNRNIQTANFSLKKTAGASATAWAATTAVTLGTCVHPVTANGHYYKCTVAGTTGASAPTWPTDGSTVTDGTATWIDAGVITLTPTIDYVVEYQSGMVMPTIGGAATLGDNLTVTYDHHAVSGNRVSGGLKRSIYCRVRLRGVNLANQEPIEVYIPYTSLYPNGAVEFMSENYATFDLKGSPTLATGESAPYYVDILNPF
ncbi:MAG: hypothetical protein HQL66_03260 [Magnetococcales bacterium]|nr:hypothetical protein [Magnetococcales bacterium]